jgi:hypothetical protein
MPERTLGVSPDPVEARRIQGAADYFVPRAFAAIPVEYREYARRVGEYRYETADCTVVCRRDGGVDWEFPDRLANDEYKIVIHSNNASRPAGWSLVCEAYPNPRRTGGQMMATPSGRRNTRLEELASAAVGGMKRYAIAYLGEPEDAQWEWSLSDRMKKATAPASAQHQPPYNWDKVAVWAGVGTLILILVCCGCLGLMNMTDI